MIRAFSGPGCRIAHGRRLAGAGLQAGRAPASRNRGCERSPRGIPFKPGESAGQGASENRGCERIVHWCDFGTQNRSRVAFRYAGAASGCGGGENTAAPLGLLPTPSERDPPAAATAPDARDPPSPQWRHVRATFTAAAAVPSVRDPRFPMPGGRITHDQHERGTRTRTRRPQRRHHSAAPLSAPSVRDPRFLELEMANHARSTHVFPLLLARVNLRR